MCMMWVGEGKWVDETSWRLVWVRVWCGVGVDGVVGVGG